MAIITPHIWCPLCEAEMVKQKMMYGSMRATAYTCIPCNLFTFAHDPAFNKWRDADKKIPCPKCLSEVKWFSRHIDSFMAFVCPKCGVKGRGDCNSMVNPDGSIDLELMEGSEQAPVENRVEVPIDNLKIPQDMKNKLKAKMRRNRERGR